MPLQMKRVGKTLLLPKIKKLYQNWRYRQNSCITFTKEILHRKLHFFVQCLLLFYSIDVSDHQWIRLPTDKPILRREVENICTVYSSLNSFLLWQLFSLRFYCALWQRKYNTCIVVQSQPHSPMYFLILFVYLHQQLLLSTKSSTLSSREIKL